MKLRSSSASSKNTTQGRRMEGGVCSGCGWKNLLQKAVLKWGILATAVCFESQLLSPGSPVVSQLQSGHICLTTALKSGSANAEAKIQTSAARYTYFSTSFPLVWSLSRHQYNNTMWGYGQLIEVEGSAPARAGRSWYKLGAASVLGMVMPGHAA